MYMIGKHVIKELLLWPRKYILIAVESGVKKKTCLIDSLLFQKKHRIWGEDACLPRCKILEKISLISIVLGVGFLYVLYVHMCQRTTFVS